MRCRCCPSCAPAFCYYPRRGGSLLPSRKEIWPAFVEDVTSRRVIEVDDVLGTKEHLRADGASGPARFLDPTPALAYKRATSLSRGGSAAIAN
jgi:hypothetical protein